MEKQNYSPKEFENTFDKFILEFAGGCRIDQEYASIIPENTKAADYHLSNKDIIIELKCLAKSHGSTSYVLDLIEKAVKQHGFPSNTLENWMSRQERLPKKIRGIVDSTVQNSLKGAVRKANMQLTSSKKLLGRSNDGILIVANLNETLFSPVELLRNIAGHVLNRTSSDVDAVLLITPGVKYSTPKEGTHHYAIPVYADGKEYLGEFIDPFVTSWLRYEAELLGVKLDLEVLTELDEASKSARASLTP
tara:strand:- start:104 stop:850 length:747 start_codon:yes stop_codon:yes gene_type:complete